jgi:pseudouridine-5'-phosphate glycosidase
MTRAPGGPLVVAPAVREALAARRPVVALETTLVTHGLPRPEGVRIAALLEDDVRAGGATPATIGVLDGAIRVGLSTSDLERLASAKDVSKLNLGNLAAQVALGDPGSMTVAATLFAAARAGIEVFATGGIGGVHRDAAESGDVSSDLTALARYPVAVVCAGAKAVLDLHKTTEWLETLGVPVLGYRTDEFPAFYRRSSGRPVDRRFDAIEPLARAVRAHWVLGLGTGVVVANPIPAADELPQALVDEALAAARASVAQAGVRGRAVTPFLLETLDRLTHGRSVTANIALLRHNARTAAALAVALGE